MKYIGSLIAVVVFLASLPAKGQTFKRDENKDRYLHKFVGTWEYTYGSSSFQLVLVRATADTEVSYGPCLVGGYRLLTNSVVQADYTHNLPTLFTGFKNFTAPLLAGEPYGEVYDVLILSFEDKGLSKHAAGEFELLSPTTARFTLDEPEGMYMLRKGETRPPEGFSVPNNVVLTKIR